MDINDMGFFGNALRAGARVGGKILGLTGHAIRTLGHVTSGAAKHLGHAAPYVHGASAALAPAFGPEGMVAHGALSTALTHGPSVLAAIGQGATGIGHSLHAAGGHLSRWGGA